MAGTGTADGRVGVMQITKKMASVKMIRCLIGLFLTLLILTGIDGGWRATRSLWPGIYEDGSMYTTVVINRANGLGNTFDVFTPNIRVNNGDRTFRVHGQLYHPLIAALITGRGYDALLTQFHRLNLLGFLLALLLFYLVPARRLATSPLVSLGCGVSCAYATTSLLQYLQGRPDHGVVLVLLLAGLFNELVLRDRFTSLKAGIAIGVVGAISPLPGYLLGMLTVLSSSLRVTRFRKLVVDSTISLVVSLLVWVVLTSIVYAGPLSDLFTSTVRDGMSFQPGMYQLFYNFPQMSLARIASALIWVKYAPFLITPLLLVTLMVLIIAGRRLAGRDSWPLNFTLAGLLFTLSGQLWFFILHWPERHYDVIGLYPAIFLWMLRQLMLVERRIDLSLQVTLASRGIEHQLRLDRQALTAGLVVIMSLVVAMPGLGFLRTSLIQRGVIEHGVSYSMALARFQQLKESLAENEYILIDSWSSTNGRSSVVFDGPPWKSRASVWGNDLNESFSGMKARYYFTLQDSLLDTNVPVQSNGYRLIEKNLTEFPVRIFGISVTSITPGYGYVIYEKETSSPPGTPKEK